MPTSSPPRDLVTSAAGLPLFERRSTSAPIPVPSAAPPATAHSLTSSPLRRSRERRRAPRSSGVVSHRSGLQLTHLELFGHRIPCPGFVGWVDACALNLVSTLSMSTLICGFLLNIYAFLSLRYVFWSVIKLPGLLIGDAGPCLLLVVMGMVHCRRIFGTRAMALFAALTLVLSWCWEYIAVETSLMHGAYEYTDKMGWKLGHVPLLIPFAWLSMLYPAHIIARVILDGGVLHVSALPIPPSQRRRPSTGRKRKQQFATGLGSEECPLSVWRFAQRTLLLSTLTSLVMTAWDLPMDPVMVEEGYWVWKDGGAFFGVPVQNFVGWFLLGFLICALFLTAEYARSSTQDRSLRAARRRRHSRVFLCLPVLAYALLGLTYLEPYRIPHPALNIIAFFAMQTPAWCAIGRLWNQTLFQFDEEQS